MITICTQPYENANGGKAPRGIRTWEFHFGGYTLGDPISIDFEYTGSYGDAKKAAIKAIKAAQTYPGRFGNGLVLVGHAGKEEN